MSTYKRRRVDSTWNNYKDKLRCNDVSHTYTLETLPSEVIEMIIRLLPLQEVAETVRIVSRRCSMIATIVLNTAFFAAHTKIEATSVYIEKLMASTNVTYRLLICSRCSNYIETIRGQYNLLKAVIWRYTNPPRRQTYPRLCFYAGSLLDKLNSLLQRIAGIVGQPKLHSPNLDSKITSFVSMCKRFMNHFERVSERRINRSPLISGCKAVDILDCLIEGRHVLSLYSSNRGDTINMKLKYVMKRTWFTCLEIPCVANENCWRDRQRFMYLRLRRLVSNINENYLERLHYERLKLYRIPSLPIPRPPTASTYSGYGEYGGQFFYYGNMNEDAYENKFHEMTKKNETNSGDEKDKKSERTCLELVIKVDLRCSPDLAPLAIRSALELDDIDNCGREFYKRREFYLKLNIVCPVSMANRLPSKFTWEVQNPRPRSIS